MSLLVLILLSSCAVPAIPAAAGIAGAGGVTLYKKQTSYGPNAEFVLIKFESNHIENVVQPPTPTPTQK